MKLYVYDKEHPPENLPLQLEQHGFDLDRCVAEYRQEPNMVIFAQWPTEGLSRPALLLSNQEFVGRRMFCKPRMSPV